MHFDIRYYESVASTMDLARRAIKDNAEEGLVIQAGEQISGRGRRGNAWQSPKGNLYQSFVLKPGKSKSEWGQLSFVIAVSLADAVMDICPHTTDLFVKWPNDVLLGGKKLAGILIEAEEDMVIVGTGVNIQYAPEDRAKVEDIAAISVNDFRDVFLQKISANYGLWKQEGFLPIRQKWLSLAYKKGQKICANLKDKSIEGVFDDIDNSGALLLRSDSGKEYVITSSEIINWNT